MFSLPIYWNQTQNNAVLVSINAYRNWHYHTSSKFKRDFHELLSKQLTDTSPITTTYSMRYDLYYKNSNCDGSNIIALIEKTVLDTLQEANILPNDTVKYHLGSSWSVIGQDKLNPRVEITIIPKA